MADKDFMSQIRRGGSSTDLRVKSIVATTDGVRNDAGYGRGFINPATAAVPQGYRPDSLRGSNDSIPGAAHDLSCAAPSSQYDTYDIKFLPNLLDNYDTYTYHWKLFITPLEAARSGEVMTRSAQTIIAESGVSDLIIDKVELNGIAVPSVEAGTGTQTLMKFEIVEPSGAGLLDKMFYQSLALGIGNWLVMPCFLQLEFRGRDPASSVTVTDGAPGTLGGLQWVWPIKLTNAKANVTQVGTRYEFDAVLYDELAQGNSYFSIQHNTVLTALDTFGKAMSDLENKLNADQFEKLIDNYSIADTYRIVVDPNLARIAIVDADANKSTSRGSDFVDLIKKVASYNSGTGIDKIVDSLLGSSKEMQSKMQASDTPTSEPKSAEAAPPMRKFWRIITETKPIAYDILRQDNAVEVTIFIVEYDLGLVDVTPSQNTDSLPAAKRRISDYVNKKILNKKYNYIFTGLNDQVFTFDLAMNFSFAASLSRFGGVYYDAALNNKGISQQENAKAEQEATNTIRQTLQFINNPNNGRNVDSAIRTAQESIKNADIDPVLKSRYSVLLANAKPADKRAFTDQVAAAGGVNAAGELNTNRFNAVSLAAPTENGLKFISDVNINSPAAKAARDIADANRRGKLRPIPFRESNQEINLSMAIDPSSDAGRSRTASVFSTALYSTLDASLQVVKLTVKGDPYWLFPRNIPIGSQLQYKSNMSDAVAIQSIKDMQNTSSVNLYGSDNFIVIRFRTPKTFNETTGSVDPFTEVETFSGVYKVISIVSKFEMGKFVQELNCILDPMINLADFPQFLHDIETANQIPDVTISSNAPTLPLNASKTQRLSNPLTQLKGQVDTVRDNITGQVVDINRSVTDSIGTTVNAVKSNIPTVPNITATDLLNRQGVNLDGPRG